MIYCPTMGSMAKVTVHIGGGERSGAFDARYLGRGQWRLEVVDENGEPQAFPIHPTHQPEWADLDKTLEDA